MQTKIMLKTRTGYAEKTGEWRDGAFPAATGGVARLTVRDDQTNAVWRFSGRRADAVAAIASSYLKGFGRDTVACLYGSHIEIESQPEGFWIGRGEPNEDGDFDELEPNLTAFPNVVAY